MVDAAIRPPAKSGIRLASLYALVGGAAALALAGGVLAVGTLRGGTAPAVHHRGHLGQPVAAKPANDIGRALPTSFGVVSARSVKQLRGMTAKDLAGMTHFPSYVAPDQVQVQAVIQLTNTTNHLVTYSPEQFRLVVDDGKAIAPLHATFPAGRLQPSAAIDGQITFITPRRTRARAQLWLEFTERGVDKPVRIDIGTAVKRSPRAGPAPTSDDTDHAHNNHPPPP